MKNEIRKICFLCGAKKYVKYLTVERELNRRHCKNLEKCAFRSKGVNYRK